MAKSKTGTFKKFPATFWVANTMELFERWAWYGIFVVIALYLTGSSDTGALGFSQTQKGMIMGIVSAILYFLPVILGAFADRWGYKKSLVIAYIILTSGYLSLGFFSSFYSVFFAFLYVGIGAALFKPIIAATVSKTTTNETSSVGFGIYYMTVNIGGFIGPLVAAKLRLISWDYVFIMSAAIIMVNLLLVVFFFKEPRREPSDDSLLQSLKKIFTNIATVLKDYKFAIFLLILVGFWTIFWQLYYTLPNFIEQWVNTRVIYDVLHAVSPGLANFFGAGNKTIPPELIINLDALFIIIFQLVVSSFVARFKPVNSIAGGFLVLTLGISLTFFTSNGLFVILGIFIFSLGEMASSPKITEYIGKIAPRDKTALYMGTSFLPVAGGNFIAGFLSGPVFERMSDKFTLLHKELVAKNIFLDDKIKVLSKNEFFTWGSEKLGLTTGELTQYLWNTYHPQKIWILYAAIGLFTGFLLIFYNKFWSPAKQQ